MPKPTLLKKTASAAGELEAEFAEMNGYEAEAEAATLLSGLGIGEDLREKLMRDLESGEKVTCPFGSGPLRQSRYPAARRTDQQPRHQVDKLAGRLS